MKENSGNKRIELAPGLPEVDEDTAKKLAAAKIQFLLPEEMELVGGGAALQFAYDFPEGYA